MTGSITGIISHDHKFVFHHEHKAMLNALSNFAVKISQACAFAGCFSQAQWQSVQAVLGLNGDNLGVAV